MPEKPEEPDSRNPLSKKNVSGMSTFVGMGIIIGTVVGVLIDNIGLGISLGLVFGAAIGATRARRAG